MNVIKMCLAVFAALYLISCADRQSLIDDPVKKDIIKADFQQKEELLKDAKGAFSVFNSKLTANERLALEFLYAYAPLSDVMVSGDLYLDHVKATLKAKKEMEWKEIISDDLFLHFVLPIRVNNEYIDSSRTVFYNELKDRVKGMSLEEAALEVNHWCHEKAVYTPSDSRTSSPLSTVKTAYGRCGEESVFTVAALRSVGIPARQVYTPRWAHSDDNHAWVEVWTGEKWSYMGACEPEPKLDMGWFTAPSKRAMLMHTKVYGRYKGDEEIMSTNPSYTEINVTENYAPVKKIDILIVDKDGKHVDNADIEIKIYNYAELYSVAAKKSDKDGKSSINMGIGDFVIWASKDGQYGYSKVSMAVDDNVTVTLNNSSPKSLAIDIVPPIEKKSVSDVTSEERTTNAKRLLTEDSIRMAYVSTFMSKDQAKMLAESLSLDTSSVMAHIKDSRGNYDNIAKYLVQASKIDSVLAMDMLTVISQKDLRDISSEVLMSHFNSAVKYKDAFDKDIFVSYILNPRINNEMITSYRDVFVKELGDKKTVENIVKLVSGVKIDEELNKAVAKVIPQHLLKLMIADKVSRDIFFVALCRTYGIPSRLEPATMRPQYYADGKWNNVDFETVSNVVVPKGKLSLLYDPIKAVPDPKYGTHFTISKLNDNAMLSRINLDKDMKYDMGGATSSKEIFAEPMPLDEGRYMLTAGTRLADGSVLAYLSFFNVKKDSLTTVDLVLRENNEDIFVLGSINPEAKITECKSGNTKSVLDITGRGYFVLALVEAKKEPVNHSMRTLSKIRNNIDHWGRPVLLALKNKEQYDNFDKTEFGLLPNIEYVIDSNAEVETMFKDLKLNTNDLPIYVIADSFGKVVFISQGYQINLGDNILKVISGL